MKKYNALWTGYNCSDTSNSTVQKNKPWAQFRSDKEVSPRSHKEKAES